MSRARLAMIGLDAAELGFIEAHRSQLPRLAELLATGSLSRLDSTAGLLPGSVWPTFFTGAPPGQHGIHHHLQWDAERMGLRRVSAAWLDCEPFWAGLERAGRAVCVVDVPMTLANVLRHGVEIANWGSHDQLRGFEASPGALGRALRRRFGAHPMGPEIPVRKTPRELERIRRALVAGAEAKAGLACWLYAERAWDLFLCVFGESHRGGHILWPAREGGDGALLDVYRALDRGVGSLVDALAPESVLVLFSLHGMGPNTSQEHFVPGLMDRIEARFRAPGPDAPRGVPRRGLVRALRERVPAGLQNAVARAVPVAVRDWVMHRQISAGRNWAATRGFATLADLNGYLRFNLAGGERAGALAPGSEEHAAYRSWLERCFTSLRVAGTGAPLVEAVIFEHPELEGPRRERLPDAIVTWREAEPAARIESELLGALAGELATGRGGNHRPHGFCLVRDASGLLPAGPAPRHIAELAGFVARALGAGG